MHNKTIPFAFASALGALVLLGTDVPALAQQEVWSGLSDPETGDNNFTTGDNWVDQTAPLEGAAVIIDDTTPRPTVELDDEITISSLMVGDGHTLQTVADITLTVHADGPPPNFDGLAPARFEGVVELIGPGKITTDYIVVNTDQDTVIKYTGDDRDPVDILDTLAG